MEQILDDLKNPELRRKLAEEAKADTLFDEKETKRRKSQPIVSAVTLGVHMAIYTR